MRFEDLPGIPEIWFDFLQRRLPALPFPGTIEELAVHAEQLRNGTADRGFIRIPLISKSEWPRLTENIQRISRPDAVAVVADLYPGLFGGPVCQVLKCLTAIKVCEILMKNSCNAVPVAWTHAAAPPEFPDQSVSFLDHNAGTHSFKPSSAEVVSQSLSELIPRIADFGRGEFDTESLSILRNSFTRERSLSSATARLFRGLMRDFGMIVIHHSDSSAASSGTTPLPVLARVIGPCEIDSFARGIPQLYRTGFSQTMVWPQVSATIGDARIRRTLGKYHLELPDLYRGEREVLDRLKREWPSTGLAKLEGLAVEVEAGMEELKSCFSEKAFLKAGSSSREKVLYQIGKLGNLFKAAMKSKEQTASLRIRKACNFMAPNGRLQEKELAGIQIPLSYSLAGLRMLYEKLDILNFEHQLIWMD
jgi:uncharacterized protein YllA (UPF0747 family)